MYTLKFFFDMYPQLTTPPLKIPKTKKQKEKEKEEKKRRQDLFISFQAKYWDLISCIN